jgi:hypothetical protein
MLDGGLTIYACLLADMCYWMMVGVAAWHTSLRPTPVEVFFVTHGFLLMAFTVSLVVWITVMVRGY